MARLSRWGWCALLAVGAAVPALASEHWIRVTTPDFEMYTTSSEKQAVRALQTFEQVRHFFLAASNKAQAPEGRVRIIAFSNEQQYKPYRMNAGNFAYYQQHRERDYIVMQDILPEHSQAAIHEYTHLIIRHANLTLPLWLDEGMAELYSSLEPKGDKALVGRPLEGDAQDLATHQWIDWNVLFQVDHSSPYYNDPKLMQMFYAQSWAMTHMLALGPAYRPGFARLLVTVSSGTPTAEALQAVYGKTVMQVGEDLRAYVRQSRVYGALYDVKLSKAELDPEVSEVSPFQSNLLLAELLAARPETAEEGKKRLLGLEHENPKDAELEEALGYLAWEQNDISEACKRFGLAVERGSSNPVMMLHYSELLQAEPKSFDKISDVVNRVLQAQPDNVEARIVLASAAARANRYGAILAALVPVHNVKPEQACQFFTLLAFAHANMRNYSGAKEFANRALPYAKSADERSQLENILRFADMASNPSASVVRRNVQTSVVSEGTSVVEERVAPERPRDPSILAVRGTTKSFECGKGAFRLRVIANGRDMVFDLPPDPKDILVRTAQGSAVLEWHCGAMQAQNVEVLYRRVDGSKTDGVITELHF